MVLANQEKQQALRDGMEPEAQRIRHSLLGGVDYIIIGAVEWIALPQLGVGRLRARVDTGAAGSALHVDNIETFQRAGKRWVRFDVVTGSARHWRHVSATALLAGTKRVRNTSGEVEERYVINTLLTLGEQQWTIPINLTNRDKMRYRMLLGRSAMRQHVLVNPSRLYLHAFPAAAMTAANTEPDAANTTTNRNSASNP